VQQSGRAWQPVCVPVLVAPEDVDRCEVVRVRLERSGGWRVWNRVPGEVVAVVSGQDSEQILGLLAELPNGEQMRCFMPHFGVRFWAGETLRAEAALSFKCNNALTFVDGRRGWFEFDAVSQPALKLHGALERHARLRATASKQLTRDVISDFIAEFASKIDSPRNRLPGFERTNDLWRPRIELDESQAVYVVVEDGQERSRRSTANLDELLYWVFVDVTFHMACVYEVRHRVEGENPWRAVYSQQVALLQALDQLWFERFQREKRARLDELNL
jgi:hypothetical protein